MPELQTNMQAAFAAASKQPIKKMTQSEQLYRAVANVPGKHVRDYSDACGVHYSTACNIMAQLEASGLLARDADRRWSVMAPWDQKQYAEGYATVVANRVPKKPASAKAGGKGYCATVKAPVCAEPLSQPRIDINTLTIAEARELWAELSKIFK